MGVSSLFVKIAFLPRPRFRTFSARSTLQGWRHCGTGRIETEGCLRHQRNTNWDNYLPAQAGAGLPGPIGAESLPLANRCRIAASPRSVAKNGRGGRVWRCDSETLSKFVALSGQAID